MSAASKSKPAINADEVCAGWQAHQPGAGDAGLHTRRAFLPVGQAWLGKWIVDAVVTAINTHVGAEAGLRAVLPYLAAELSCWWRKWEHARRTFAEHSCTRNQLYIKHAHHPQGVELDLSHC